MRRIFRHLQDELREIHLMSNISILLGLIILVVVLINLAYQGVYGGGFQNLLIYLGLLVGVLGIVAGVQILLRIWEKLVLILIYGRK